MQVLLMQGWGTAQQQHLEKEAKAFKGTMLLLPVKQQNTALAVNKSDFFSIKGLAISRNAWVLLTSLVFISPW